MSQKCEEFERLVQEHANVMSLAIRRVCGRRYDGIRHDVQQEVYLALWRRLDGGAKIEHPTSYLYKVALTTALAVIKRLKLDVTTNLGDEVDPPQESGGFGNLLPAERARLLREVLAHLAPDGARALRAYLSGFNHREIAELYGWSESVARHQIYRSIEQLRKRLSEHEPFSQKV